MITHPKHSIMMEIVKSVNFERHILARKISMEYSTLIEEEQKFTVI